MSTTFAELSLDEIHAHLHNPRRQAIADPEMVESIKTHGLIEPLIVAPADNGYVLIAGHRRKNGLEQAGIKVAPALIRTDLVTEPLQIEAMLIENGHREDLTPIEEADGYEQLELFGYKPRDIAKATGRSEKTVKSRLKLRDLSTATRTKVHEGQVTIHDALELLAFTDQPDVLEKLETAAGTSNFQYELARAQRAQAAHAEQMKLRNRVAVEGIPEAESTEHWNRTDGPYPLLWFSSYDKDAEGRDLSKEATHDGCLSWTSKDDRVWLTCSNPASHRPAPAAADPEDEARRAAEREEWERQQAANAAHREAMEAAAQVRVAHASSTVAKGKPSDIILDLVAGLLPAWLVNREREYGDVPAAVRTALGYPADGPTASQMIRDALAWTPAQLTAALAAVFVQQAEDVIEAGDFRHDYEDDAQVLDLYFRWLADTDHSFCDVDTTLRGEVTAALTEDDEDQAEAS